MVEINIWNDNRDKLTSIYEDYPTHPYCSSERSLWSYSKEYDGYMRTFSIIPREMMEKLPNGLLLGHIKLLWRISLNYFSYKTRIPSYFEYEFGVDVKTELVFLTGSNYIYYDDADSIFKMTEKGLNEFNKYKPWLDLSEIKYKYRNKNYKSYPLTELIKMLNYNTVQEIELFLINNQINESFSKNDLGVLRNSYLDLYKLNIKQDENLAFENLCYIISFDLACLNKQIPSMIIHYLKLLIEGNNYEECYIESISNRIWSEYHSILDRNFIKDNTILFNELSKVIYSLEEK